MPGVAVSCCQPLRVLPQKRFSAVVCWSHIAPPTSVSGARKASVACALSKCLVLEIIAENIPDAHAQTTEEQHFVPGVDRNKTDALHCQVPLYMQYITQYVI